MTNKYKIRSLRSKEASIVTEWARSEGFAPGIGDVNIYRNTDKQGIWLGLLNNIPIGCIVGVRYNINYGFLGLYIVKKEFRGMGYGLTLWKHVLNEMRDIHCIGLEAAPDRIKDYSKWGFEESSITTRFKYDRLDNFSSDYLNTKGLLLLDQSEITSDLIQSYDAKKEETVRPHFLADWLSYKSGKVIAMINENKECVGFGRIRPCLLTKGKGWRIGPLIANTPDLARILIGSLLTRHKGIVYIDSPGLNSNSKDLLKSIGFKQDSYTVRMYKGKQKDISLNDVYGLACLELG